MAGVLLIDQVLLRFIAPNFKIPRLRPVVFLAKYLLVPCIGFTVVK
jgi:hypothetical protein